jgi:DNA primase large subunit
MNGSVGIPYEFTLHFTDYLRNTTLLREKKWKLVGRLLSNGNVYVTRNETARLLSEEVRRQIEKCPELKELTKFPPKIIETPEKIKARALNGAGDGRLR